MPLRVVKIQYGTEQGGRFSENPTRFEKCVEAVSARGDVDDPKAVCAAIGRKKYGKKKFQKMAAAGRKRAAAKRKNVRKDRIVRRADGLYYVYAIEDRGEFSYRTDTKTDAESWLREHSRRRKLAAAKRTSKKNALRRRKK